MPPTTCPGSCLVPKVPGENGRAHRSASGNDDGTQPLRPPLGRLMNLTESSIVRDANGSGMTRGKKVWQTSWHA
jgi:hypothetical protein